jgi:hypothetical protein
VVTNNESAEYGRASGATINVASRSGTNRIHAALYEFIRNTDLNAAGFFKPTVVGGSGITTPFVKPTFNRNQYGFDVGGPILKDKFFFFLDYEGFRQVLKPLTVLTLPTQNELNGILVQPVRNALTGVIYPAGTPIPTSAINPLSQQIISYFKQISGLPVAGITTASTANGVTGLASNDYAKQVPFNDNADKGDLRLDWQINPASSAFLRVSDRKEDGLNFPSIPVPLDGQTNGKIRILDQQIALGYTQTIGANKVLDVRMGLDRTKAGKYNLSIGNTAFNSIPGLPTTNTVVAGGLPSIGITGFSGFGRQSTNPQWQDPALIDPKVNFTWIKGNHSLKFGYEYEHIWMAVNDNNPLYGSWTYGGGYSVCTPTTSASCATNSSGGAAATTAVSDTYWADFLFGTTNQYSLANYYEAHLTQNMHSVYAQDDWKVNSSLTLNLGLRWEYGAPYSEAYNNLSNFDPADRVHGYPHAWVHRHQQCRPLLGWRRLRQDADQSLPWRLRSTRRLCLGSHSHNRCPRRLRHQLRPLHPRRFGRHPGHQRAQRTVCLCHAALARSQRPAIAPSIRATRQISPPAPTSASTPVPTTSPTSPKTPRTATSRATSSACRRPSPRTPCWTSPSSATTASNCKAS